MHKQPLIFIIIFLITSSLAVMAQDTTQSKKDDAPNIYIDCQSCDIDYIRKEITFVNYVIDHKNADIHILITKENTASSGRKYTLTYIGRNQFINNNDTIYFYTYQEDTDDIIRSKMVQFIKLGLIRYLIRMPLAKDLSIKYNIPSESQELEDPWNNWVFTTSLNGYFGGQKLYNYSYFNMRFRANHITDDWNIRLTARANYSEDNYKVTDENNVEETITSHSRGQALNGLIVRSISDHWSIGGFYDAYTSTYLNLKLRLNAYPAIEYNIFPYPESTRRELRLLYRIGYTYTFYNEETIYDKLEEGLFEEVLTLSFELIEPWGSVKTSISGLHYFHDFKKNALDIYSELSLRIFKGLSLELWGGFSMIHNQMSLAKGDISRDDVLLRRRQLESQYSYWGSIGFSYTFGSIYNNIVNPRFGG